MRVYKTMKNKVGDNEAFTITEMIVVIVIISIIAAFGIPSYTRMMSKNQERTMILNLLTIRSAVEIWAAKNNNNNPSADWGNLNTINTNLSINAVDGNSTYSCTWTGAVGDQGCIGIHPDAWEIHFHPLQSGGRLHCNNGPCPSCPVHPGDCG